MSSTKSPDSYDIECTSENEKMPNSLKTDKIIQIGISYDMISEDETLNEHYNDIPGSTVVKCISETELISKATEEMTASNKTYQWLDTRLPVLGASGASTLMQTSKAPKFTSINKKVDAAKQAANIMEMDYKSYNYMYVLKEDPMVLRPDVIALGLKNCINYKNSKESLTMRYKIMGRTSKYPL